MTKYEASIKTIGQPLGPFLESFHIGVLECFHEPLCWAPSSVRIEGPSFGTLPYVSLHLAADLYLLIIFV